ncbi:GNAT family N-acetyltransferase [Candidimonas humi]|nr:GNAT family N-acetyltransferase [Candidimonas humi]
MHNDNGISQPTLSGRLVELRPLGLEHEGALLQAAADGELWNLKVTVVPGPQTVRQYIAAALARKQEGSVMPYVIVRKDTDRIVGSTRYWKIDAANRRLEIGSTWLSASAQRTGINTEAKYLMLEHAFESMRCVRVQFTTDQLNARSRAAIMRLGARPEGIVRNERIMPDGRRRNSVRFSIIDTEWPEVKAMLQARLQGRAGG